MNWFDQFASFQQMENNPSTPRYLPGYPAFLSGASLATQKYKFANKFMCRADFSPTFFSFLEFNITTSEITKKENTSCGIKQKKEFSLHLRPSNIKE